MLDEQDRGAVGRRRAPGGSRRRPRSRRGRGPELARRGAAARTLRRWPGPARRGGAGRWTGRGRAGPPARSMPHGARAVVGRLGDHAFGPAPSTARWVHGRSPERRASRPSATFSRTVSESNSSMRWNVRPRPSWARRCGGGVRDVGAVDAHLPAGRSEQPGAGVERGGLPGAVRADQRGDLSGRGAEGDAVDGDDAAELHGQVVDLEAAGVSHRRASNGRSRPRSPAGERRTRSWARGIPSAMRRRMSSENAHAQHRHEPKADGEVLRRVRVGQVGGPDRPERRRRAAG